MATPKQIEASIHACEELIQVAAVAVAAVEDMQWGLADASHLPTVITEVVRERTRQNEKWGSQHHTPMEWLAILGEEVGEVCRAVMDGHEWSPPF